MLPRHWKQLNTRNTYGYVGTVYMFEARIVLHVDSKESTRSETKQIPQNSCFDQGYDLHSAPSPHCTGQKI